MTGIEAKEYIISVMEIIGDQEKIPREAVRWSNEVNTFTQTLLEPKTPNGIFLAAFGRGRVSFATEELNRTQFPPFNDESTAARVGEALDAMLTYYLTGSGRRNGK